MINLRWVSKTRRAVWFPLLGLLVFAGSLLPSLQTFGTQFGGLPSRPFDALAVVAVALQSLSLAGSRRWPIGVLALVSAGFAIDQLCGYHSFAGSALPVAVLNVGWRAERGRRAAAVGFTAAYLAFVAAFPLRGGGESAAGVIAFYLSLVVVWGIGAWLRSTRAAEAERRRRVAEETRAAERSRIARELHDVVTHHVTAMVVQTEAARYLTGDRLEQTLSSVTSTGRQAIAELRNLLDLLNPGAQPGLGLDTLVEQTRRAGQPVEFTEEGTPAPADSSAVPVAYGVVREALTNALKHAHGSPTSVQVRHGEEGVTVEVRTGSGADAAIGGSGRGLAGLRERVDDAGGEFSAGRAEDGGFYVRARIPA
ncbi:sensor histidine kinase [Amycolatopsis sp. GA6-003]|uniref:sensor histidine kinase n=1 Tax=Amycolatopsis sp. GA6-003 TaxID=2652444 RepID=UPI00391704CB